MVQNPWILVEGIPQVEGVEGVEDIGIQVRGEEEEEGMIEDHHHHHQMIFILGLVMIEDHHQGQEGWLYKHQYMYHTMFLFMYILQ